MVRDKPLRDLRRQETVSIPDGVQTIKSNWFQNCKAQSVTVPASVTEIEKEAFRKCKKLSEVEFTKGSVLKVMGKLCFAFTVLVEITIPNSVTVIGEYAFF